MPVLGSRLTATGPPAVVVSDLGMFFKSKSAIFTICALQGVVGQRLELDVHLLADLDEVELRLVDDQDRLHFFGVADQTEEHARLR